jgi:2-polyprenyl-3-methyl-5-hydroxy-6-metoxy-1,4-benzoquinol methylase
MNYYNNIRIDMLEFIPPECKIILEVGCGEGLFGEQLMQQRRAEVWGVEPSIDAAAIAATRLTKIIHGTYDDTIALPEQYFDCIVFNDVLEHMIDPWSILRGSRRFLKKNQSWIVASIPNFRNWHNIIEIVVKKEFLYRESGILDKTHYRFFTERSIRTLFNTSGFDIIRCVGINPILSKKFKFANFLLLNSIRDMRFMQFAVVSKPQERERNSK